jgi:hypothetical protein
MFRSKLPEAEGKALFEYISQTNPYDYIESRRGFFSIFKRPRWRFRGPAGYGEPSRINFPSMCRKRRTSSELSTA